MSSERSHSAKFWLDDLIALAGLAFLVAGFYLWLGLPAALILTGIVLIYIGARLPIPTQTREQHESD